MRRFEDYLKVILLQEGGSKYTEDESDMGGATKFGISLNFYKNIKPLATKEDIKNLTEEEAKQIYRIHFWNRMNLDYLDNELLKLHIFSHGVNAGVATAVKMLQRILGVIVDGKLGKTTAMTTNKYRHQPELVQGYANARKVFYDTIVSKNPSQSKFIKGWYNRVDNTKFI